MNKAYSHVDRAVALHRAVLVHAVVRLAEGDTWAAARHTAGLEGRAAAVTKISIAEIHETSLNVPEEIGVPFLSGRVGVGNGSSLRRAIEEVVDTVTPVVDVVGVDCRRRVGSFWGGVDGSVGASSHVNVERMDSCNYAEQRRAS